MRRLAGLLAPIVALSACAPRASLGSFGYLTPPAGAGRSTGLGLLDAHLAAAMHATYREAGAAPEEPLALVPTDGSELALRSLEAAVDIDGPLARTELRLVFHNPEARVREGRFAITLPPGATVGRFAMKVGGEWREARIVSRTKGRQVYETFLHRGVDPALLEQDLGNRFSARVFPIEANADKEIIIAYEHGVSSDAPYRLALTGLPYVPTTAITIRRDGVARKVTTRGDKLADIVESIDESASAVTSRTAFVARLSPDVLASAAPSSTVPQTIPPIDSLLVLVDTSASRAPVMATQASLVRDLLAQLPGETRVSVAAFDHRVTPLYEGTAGGTRDIATAILDHGALGASDLGAALVHAQSAGAKRVVLAGDGVPTLGETDASKLAASLADSGVERLDVVQVGASLDRDTLRALVAAGRVPGAILDGSDATRLVAQLQRAVPAEVAIRVEGALASWPATTRGLAPGTPIWVYGLRDGTGDVVVHAGDRTATVRALPGDSTRVRRAVAGAEIAALTERMQRAPAGERAELGNQLEALALEHQLVSARTSLLVLESDELERRFLDGETPAAEATPTADAAPPAIEPASTTQGITIDRNYLPNIPVPGRTFESTLEAAAGAQDDGHGVSFSGASSLENQYYVDGVNTRTEAVVTISDKRTGPRGQFAVRADVMSPLALDLVAESMRGGMRPPSSERAAEPAEPAKPSYADPYEGTLRTTLDALAKGRTGDALETAVRWHLASPAEVAAIIALGEALEARGESALAARAYGSILDLYPNRAELVRATGERLDRIPTARAQAIDAYRRALRERPDHASTYRLLAFSLVRAGHPEEALELLGKGREQATDDRVRTVFDDDAAVIRAHLSARAGTKVATRPSIRFVLSWETDANDVDLHVNDRHGDHAFFSRLSLSSGGELAGDITTGYGPEQFAIDEPRAFPYRLRAHYYRKGPMGVGLGTVQIIRHDGKGTITVEDRPFVIQNDDAMVDLGAVAR